MKTMQRLNAAGGNSSFPSGNSHGYGYSDQYNGQIAAAKHEAKIKAEAGVGSGTAESRALQQDRRP